MKKLFHRNEYQSSVLVLQYVLVFYCKLFLEFSRCDVTALKSADLSLFRSVMEKGQIKMLPPRFKLITEWDKVFLYISDRELHTQLHSVLTLMDDFHKEDRKSSGQRKCP